MNKYTLNLLQGILLTGYLAVNFTRLLSLLLFLAKMDFYLAQKETPPQRTLKLPPRSGYLKLHFGSYK